MTVAILPEVDDVEVEILDKDLKLETFRASGKGLCGEIVDLNRFCSKPL